MVRRFAVIEENGKILQKIMVIWAVQAT